MIVLSISDESARVDKFFSPMKMHSFLVRHVFSAFLASSLFGQCLTGMAIEPGQAGPPLMEIDVGSIIERGMPIAWHPSEVVLLKPDGSIKHFKPSDIRSHSVLKQNFQPDSAMQLRGRLQKEFGRNFAVDGTGDFAIVAPTATIHVWRDRFAQLQRSFDQYFRTRGYSLKPLDFPLVGIVFPNQTEFLKHARDVGVKLQPGVVGYYSPFTNRLYAYEMKGHPDAEAEGLATIWHEAAHQIAFNRGVHQRLSIPPLWLLEGLASIFEAPGMMSQRSTIQPSDLLNRTRWEKWKSLSENPEKMSKLFQAMIVDDELFRLHPDEAYSIAWGVSLYMAERQTLSYINYVRKLSSLGVGDEYTAGKRLADFRASFNGDTLLLVKSADRFLTGL
jgi:Protein of unknown function (DUF1570)